MQNTDDYKTNIDKDMTAVSLLFEQFDARDTAAFVSFRDKYGCITDIYCGNPRMLVSGFASIINATTLPNSIVTEIDLEKNVNYFMNRKTEAKSEQLTQPSETPVKSDYQPVSISQIKDIMDRHTEPEEAWALGFCIADTSGMIATFFAKHGEPYKIVEAISASVGRFICNSPCPFCGSEWDYSHFISHVKQILSATMCVRREQQ